MSTGFRTGHQYDDPQMPVREAPMPGFKQPPRKPYVYSKLTPEAPAEPKRCRWCGRLESEHGEPVKMVTSDGLGRPCPVPHATSQYYAAQCDEAPAPLAKVLHDAVMAIRVPEAEREDLLGRSVVAGIKHTRKSIAEMLLSHPLLQGPAGEAK